MCIDKKLIKSRKFLNQLEDGKLLIRSEQICIKLIYVMKRVFKGLVKKCSKMHTLKSQALSKL